MSPVHDLSKLKLINLIIIASMVVAIVIWLIMPTDAQAWPNNSLDSASGKNYCTNCHTQKSGTLTITKLNGSTPVKNQITVPAGSSFTLEFNSKGFGYKRFTVAGAIRVPETNSGGNDKWTASIGPVWNQNAKTGQTLWAIAAQDTATGAPAQSPYLLVTNFASAAPLSKQGVTKDDGTASDLNGLAHEETFTAAINIDGTVTPGTYTLYVQGVGSDSGLRLAYNEQALTVVVSGDVIAPTAPTGLSVAADAGDGSKLNVSWVAPADGDVAGYLLYRSTDNLTFQEVARVNGIATVSYADANLKQSTTYYYKVAANDTSENISLQSTSANGTTSAAARVDTTPPPKTTNLAARAGVNKVDLSWSASIHGDIQEYRIYRGTSPGTFDFATPLGTVAANVFTYSDNTALNGQYYYYAIKAVDVASNISVKSNEVSAIPAPDSGAVQPHGSYSTNENLCYLCHNSHTALGDTLLTKNLMSEVCYTCHDGTQSTYNVLDQFNITTNPSHHKVPESRLDCADCHDPHANPTTTPRILKAIRQSAPVPQYNPDKYGFILNWLVAGPWDSNPDGTLTNTQWISESVVAPIAGENAAGAINWKAYNSTNANTNGYVDLTNAAAFGAVTQKEAYAITYIYSSYTRKTHLHIGSDDGIKVYLNGLVIHNNNMVRSYQVDEDLEYNVTMFKGWNRLLLKISQDGDSSWGFGVRFFDHLKNKPMNDFGVDLSGYRGQSVKTGSSGNNYCWVCHGSDSILGDPYGNHQTYFNTAFNEHNVSAKMPNPASGTGIKCINCHQPHGSAYSPLLRGTDDQSFCINCHTSTANPAINFTTTKAYPYTDGTLPIIPNSSNYFVGSQHEIAFAGRNGCIMCHDPHGTAQDSANYHKMLEATFPLSKVTNGNGGTASHTTAEICFKCHDIRYYFNATGNPTVGSKFGNGNGRNLHWHVGDFRLSCRTCHDPHGSKNQQWHNATISGRSGGTLNNPEMINFDWSIANNSVAGSSGYSNKVGFVSTGTSNGVSTGYSCYLNCGTNHSPKSYSRNNTGAPGISCVACHSSDEFRKNSKHPFLKPGAKAGLTIKCETCHNPDHSTHNTTNPEGLNLNRSVTWTSTGTTAGTETFTFSAVVKEFCWNCHGNSTTRTYGALRTAIVTNLGDQESKFTGKPHASLEREGTVNPYGTGNDMPCMECHVGHGASNTHLLKSVIDGTPIDAATDAGKINACMACHDGLYGTRTMPNIKSLYNAPKFPAHYFKGTKTKLLCTECHSPHGTDNPKYLLSGLQASGADFPTGMATLDVRRVCKSCHPYSDETQVVYSSGTGKATMYPLPTTIAEHASTSAASCALCHDPHKPWPATGSNGLCYSCHGNGGDAQGNIEELMGTTSVTTAGQRAGIVSFHKIYDASTPNTNDCMNNCHSTHPHDPRAKHIPGTSTASANNEQELCLKCHDSGTAPAIDRGQAKINAANYANKPHDYFVTNIMFNDGSSFRGNCTKCHQPHGSSYTYLLKWSNGDSLCTQCHDGQHKDGNGATISNIKTMYNNIGHYYKADTTKKMLCAECHIPHGSSNVKNLRDDQVTEVRNADNSVQPFPQNMNSQNYSSRDFCTTCHIPNDNDGTADYRNYTSTSGPVGVTQINELPIITAHSLTVDEHRATFTTPCTNCHNPHDPRPVGSNKDCFKCHGNTGYAFNIQTLTGIQEEVSPGVFNDFVGRDPGILSSHRIWDGYAIGTNTCMLNCHQAHVHNPRSNLIRDRRLGSGDITAPGVPTGLLATAKGTTRVDIQWSPPGDLDIEGYYIYTSTDGSNFSKTGVTGNTTFIDGGLTPNVQVWYKVTAYDKSANESGFSNVVNATPNLASDNLAPTVPTNLAISAKTTTTIRLVWSQSTDNVEVRGYKVYRSADDLTYALIGITGETVFTDGGLTPNTRYYYKVSAYDSKSLTQESAQSAAVNDVTVANTNTTKGSYTGSGGDKLEFLLGTTNTTSFATGDTVKIKLTSTRLINANNLRNTTIYDYKGTQIVRYTTATVTKATSPYEIETTFTAPSNPGVYTVWVNWTSSGNQSISAYETIVVGSTVQWIKTYKDANLMVETRDFGPTDTVYLKAFTTQGTADLTRSSWTFGRWGGTAGTQTGTFSAVTMSGDYALYSINLTNVNTVTKTTGEWYYIRGLVRTSGSVTLSSLYYMIRIQPPDVTVPSLPGIPTGSAASDTSINLSWTASASTDVVGYNVFRSVDGTNYYKAGMTTSTTFTDTGLYASTGYRYKITAFDASGNGNTVASATASAVITTNAAVADAVKPTAPTGLTATGNGAIVIAWTASSDNIGVAGYSIYRSADGGVTFLKAGSTTATEFTDTGLVAAKPYTYYVEAFDAAGNISFASLKKTATEHSTTTDSMERALCMTCHDGTGANVGLGLDPARTTGPTIGIAYTGTKHNVDKLVDSFSDGSEYFGNCTKCHEPHGSTFPKLLKWANDNNLCFNCHTGASTSGKYGGKRDFGLSVHGVNSEPGDVSKGVWSQTHSTVFSDHFGTLANWNVNYGTGVGASTLITANEGHLKVSHHSNADNTWAYAFAETNNGYSIANGISMTAELDLPPNPLAASREFTSDFYITTAKVSVVSGNNPANGTDWIRVRYDQSPSGTKVYVDKRIASVTTNLYTDASFKSYAKKARNLRIILTPSQLIVYDGPTLLVTANSLGLPSGSSYYLDIGSSSNTTEALTTEFDDLKWHDNTKGMKFITMEGGELRGNWKVDVLESPSNTLLTSVTTSNVAGATFGQGTIGTQANNKLVYFKLYDDTNTLKDTSNVKFVTPDDTWTGSYETVADSFTPRLFRGRVAGEEGVCKNCHVTHGRQDIYGQTIRAAAVAGTSINLNELCFTCHTNDNLLGSYPGNEVYKRDTHFREAQLDTDYGKGECANCHDPHGTPNGFLLRYAVNTDEPDSNGNSRKNELCLKCHDLAGTIAKTKWFRGSTYYNAVSNADHGKYAQWPADQPENRGDFIPGVCLNCHNAHGKDDGSGTETNTRKMLPVAAADNNNICYKCHDNSALAQAADLMGNGPYTNRAPGWPTVFNSADGTVTTAGSVAYKAGAHEKGGVKPTVWPSSASYPALTLAEDGQCINCHDPHGSGNPSGLLTPTAQTLCLTCHNGTQATSVNMSLANGHKTSTNHNPGEDWSDGTVVNHAVCGDCHKVHVLTVSDKLKGNDGIDKTGVKVSTLDPNLQYQLCLKCHSAYGSRTAAMLPGTGKLDLRQQFLTTNNNHHGVFGRVSNTYITVNNMSATGAAILNRAGGLPAGTPVLRCTDCHDWHTSNNVDALKWPFGTSAEKESFCKQCHSPYIYDGNETTGAPPAGTKSGYNHRGRNNHYNNTVGGCLACHGAGKNALVYGGVHGGNVTFALGAGKRFIGGTYINNWKVGSCTTSGGCNSHTESYGVKTF